MFYRGSGANRFQILLIALFAVAALCSPVYPTKTPICLDVKLSLDQESYVVSEPIVLTITFYNHSDSLLVWSAKSLWDYLKMLKTPQKLCYLRVNTRQRYYHYILPGDSIEYLIGLDDSFGNYYSVSTRRPAGLPAGDYVVTMEDERKVLDFRIIPLQFSVLEPSKLDEAAYHAYTYAWSLSDMSDKQAKREFDRGIVGPVFEEFAVQYPTSPYAAAALIAAYNMQTRTANCEKLHLLETAMLSYPDNYESHFALEKLFRVFRSESSKALAETYLRRLIAKVPGTFIARRAQTLLDFAESTTLKDWLNTRETRWSVLKHYERAFGKHPRR